jgi:hypothetical protein
MSLLRIFSHTEDYDTEEVNVLKEIEKIRTKPYVMVGVLEGSGPHEAKKNEKGKVVNPTTVVKIASTQEFGTDKAGPNKDVVIPPRPFISSTMDLQRNHFDALTDKMFDKVLSGEATVKKALDVLGLEIQKEIKARIKIIQTPRNAPSTIRAKGSSKPLIDTGQMLNSIQFETVLDGDIDNSENESTE